MKKKTTKITELVIDEQNEALAIDAISLVTSPAIEVDFVFFGKEKNNLTFAKVDEEKRELIAPALIPNKQIYRYDANTDSDYYVYFSKDTVKKAAYSYLKHNNHHKATYQHEQRVAGVLTVESWIKEGDQDKSKLYGFDLSDGTWFVKMKIENDDLWDKIKEGELRGLSIEGYFINKLEQMGKQYTDEQIRTAYKELQAEGKIQKVEFKDIKTLDKLEGEAKKILGELKKEMSKEREAFKKGKALEMKQIDIEEELELAEKKSDKILKEVQKAYEDYDKVYEKMKVIAKKGRSTADNLEKNIKLVEKAAKDLGVNVPIDEYKKVFKNLYRDSDILKHRLG